MAEQDFDFYSKTFSSLSPEQIQTLLRYKAEILKFNQKLNLIGSGTVASIETDHLFDGVASALEFKKHVKEMPKSVWDVGTGNGIPGFVWAILFKDCKFRLIDRDQRKMEFLKYAGAVCGIKNCQYSTADIMELKTTKSDLIITRGFASISKTLLSLGGVLESGGKIVMLKGSSWTRELAEVQPQVFQAWDVSPIGRYSIPGITGEFVLIQGTRK